MKKNKAVFLDRDGVINRAIVREGKPYPPSNINEVEIISGVKEALINLKNAAYVLIVVTNQPDVARGTTMQEIVEEINDSLMQHLPIDRVITCYHDVKDNCNCRKPKPGMLLAGSEEFNVDLTSSYMIGDRWRDIEAGIAAGCSTVWINYGYSEKSPASFDYVVSSLLEASQIILNKAEE